jgi:hypothetical protein
MCWRERIESFGEKGVRLSQNSWDLNLRRFARLNDDSPFETVLAEVAVKGETGIEPLMIDQGEAGAIDETEVFVVVAHENRFGRLLDRFRHSKCFNPRPIEAFHKFNGGMVADLEADQRVSFAEDEIRCYQLSV